MARAFKLCILRVRHNPSVTTISDEACRKFLIEAADRSAVLQYWRDVSFGFLDISAEMLPWYDVTVGADTGRWALTVLAYNAAQAAGRDLSGYNGFLTIALPGFVDVANPMAGQPGQAATVRNFFDGGASRFGPPDNRRFCVLPVGSSDHTFMVHEAGHVFDYGHTWGITNNGVDWNPAPPFESSNVYGDPYDIMSSGSFGSRWDPSLPRWSANPVFNRNDLMTEIPSWPMAGAWGSMGPGLSLAHLRFRDPDALGARARLQTRTAAGWSGSFTLLSTGLPSERGGLRLLVLRPPGSGADGADPDGTLYVEYRGLDGWDRGLETGGADLARRAVVVHERASDGAGTSVIWYRGRVVIPTEIDSDIKPATSDLVVTVAIVADDLSSVTVSLSTNTERRVVVAPDYAIVRQTVVGREMHEVNFLCGTNTYELRSLHVELAATYRASAFGYGGTGTPDTSRPPRLAWMVGGVVVRDAGGSLSVPTLAGDRSVTVDYSVDAAAGTLVLRNRPLDDAYEVAVVASVSEADGSQVRSTAGVTFAVDGQITRFEDAYYQDMVRCEQRVTARLNIKRRWWLPDPDPIRDIIIPPRPVDRLLELSDLIRKERPDVAEELATLAQTRQRTERLAEDFRRSITKLDRPIDHRVIDRMGKVLEQPVLEVMSNEARLGKDIKILGKKNLPRIK